MKTSALILLACVLMATVSQSFASSNPSRLVVRADSVDLKQYVGSYKFGDGIPLAKFVVKLENGSLYGEADTNGSNKLLPQAEKDTFKSTSSYGSIIVFQRDATTKAVTGLILKIMDQAVPATKEK